MTARRLGAALALAATVLALGCARPRELAQHDAESELAALVDSDEARRLLVDIQGHRARDPRLAAVGHRSRSTDVADDEPLDAGQRLDQARLRELGLTVSMDFAALTFARALGADARSRAARAALELFLADGAERSMEALRRPGGFPYTLLFAPSWLYRSHPETGSDFAPQRRLLDRLGIPNRLIASGESDSVEDNAEVIADSVRAAHGPVILVSASKSGAEVALALSRRLAPEEAANVAAWINVAGTLRGTPLADAALRPPASWLARGIFWLRRWDWAGLNSLATERSRRRLEGARLPDSITVVNLVAVPVSGSVGYHVYLGYQVLRSHGPNDGVVLLADTVWPGGVNLVALGADHLFGRWLEDTYILAILRAVHLVVQDHPPTPEPAVAAELDAD